MKAKKLRLLLASLLVFSLVIPGISAFAAFEDYPNIAAYIRGDITNNNTLNVNGDLVLVEGTYFMNGWGNNISGTIYYSGEKKEVRASENMTDVLDTVENTGDTFSTDLPDFPQAPVMESKGNFETPWHPVTTFSENSAYDTLTLTASSLFDTGSDGLIITAKKLVLNGGAHDLAGSGDLFIFVEDDIEIKQWTGINIQADSKGHAVKDKGEYIYGDSSRVHVFVMNGNINQKSQLDFAGNFYVQNGNYVQSSGSATIHGNLVMSGDSLSLSSGLVINGAIRAPNAAVNLGGGFTLNGWLIADSLTGARGTAATLNHKEATILIPSFNGDTEDPGDDEVEYPVNDIPAGSRVIIDKPREPQYAYLYGYNDEEFGLSHAITREQGAALIYRLLKSKNKVGSFAPPARGTYGDLGPRDWSYAALEYMHFIDVYGEMNKISPTLDISRGEIAKMIAFSFKLQTDDSKPMPFSDVERINPYYFYIKALADNDISIGNGDGDYQPDATLTREQFVTMINRVIDRDISDHYLIDKNSEVPQVDCPFEDIKDLGGSRKWIFDNVMLATNDFVWDEDSGRYVIDNSNRKNRYDDYIN